MADQKPEGQQPPGRTPQEIEAARKLFAGSCEFVAAAASPDSMIGISLPEVAFAGRSNVGKSSLVNALTGRRTLARTSSSPGHTRQINFFPIERHGASFRIIDAAAAPRASETLRLARIHAELTRPCDRF